MANVLINCVSAGSGGALTYLRDLIPLLVAKSNDEIDFFILIKHDQRKYLGDEIEPHIIYAPNLRGYVRFIWEYFNLPKIIKKNNINLVFTPYQIARIFKNIKNIVMFRNMEPFTFHKYKNTPKNWLRNLIIKYKTINTVKSADKVIAVSGYVRDVILENKMTSDGSIVKIYHGRNELFSPVATDNDNELLINMGIDDDYIFTCGSLFPYRKCEDIIAAFSKLTGNDKLIIAGSGNDQTYRDLLTNLISKYDLAESVFMLGHVSLEEMTVLYRNCKLFVTATETEACPNIAIEAMSSGCAILSSDIMPLPEMFGDSAIYFEHGNIEQLSQMMNDMCGSLQQPNEKALSVIKSFSWEKCANETFQLVYDELNLGEIMR